MDIRKKNKKIEWTEEGRAKGGIGRRKEERKKAGSKEGKELLEIYKKSVVMQVTLLKKRDRKKHKQTASNRM